VGDGTGDATLAALLGVIFDEIKRRPPADSLSVPWTSSLASSPSTRPSCVWRHPTLPLNRVRTASCSNQTAGRRRRACITSSSPLTVFIRLRVRATAAATVSVTT